MIKTRRERRAKAVKVLRETEFEDFVMHSPMYYVMESQGIDCGNITTISIVETLIDLLSEDEPTERIYKRKQGNGQAEREFVVLTDEEMEERGWMRLPVDENGVPCRVGDLMEECDYYGGGAIFNKCEITAVSKRCFWVVTPPEGRMVACDPSLYRHQTLVSDVLMDVMADAAEGELTPSEIVEKYGKKLRMAR